MKRSADSSARTYDSRMREIATRDRRVDRARARCARPEARRHPRSPAERRRRAARPSPRASAYGNARRHRRRPGLRCGRWRRANRRRSAPGGRSSRSGRPTPRSDRCRRRTRCGRRSRSSSRDGNASGAPSRRARTGSSCARINCSRICADVGSRRPEQRQRRTRPGEHAHVEALRQLGKQVAQDERIAVAALERERGREVPAGDMDVRLRAAQRVDHRRQRLRRRR